jgi:hypothetical protein
VLATCGIRKLLDYVFSQRELFWLDDILPGTKKPAVSNNSNGKVNTGGKQRANGDVHAEERHRLNAASSESFHGSPNATKSVSILSNNPSLSFINYSVPV